MNQVTKHVYPNVLSNDKMYYLDTIIDDFGSEPHLNL